MNLANSDRRCTRGGHVVVGSRERHQNGGECECEATAVITGEAPCPGIEGQPFDDMEERRQARERTVTFA